MVFLTKWWAGLLSLFTVECNVQEEKKANVVNGYLLSTLLVFRDGDFFFLHAHAEATYRLMQLYKYVRRSSA